jgi:hypothetical protein
MDGGAFPRGYAVRDANGQSYVYGRESRADADTAGGADDGRGAKACRQHRQAAELSSGQS